MSNIRDFIGSGHLIDVLFQDYDDASSGIYTCPDRVRYILLSAGAGGGGGGGASYNNSALRGGGAGANAGSTISELLIPCSPGDTFAWGIGNKGTGGIGVDNGGGPGANGTTGGNTTFGSAGSVITLYGGTRGSGCVTNGSVTQAPANSTTSDLIFGADISLGWNATGTARGSIGGKGGDDNIDDSAEVGGSAGIRVGGAIVQPFRGGGGGGASPFGDGGDGDGGDGAGYSAGGGGGESGNTTGGLLVDGGDGTIGFIYIRAYG